MKNLTNKIKSIGKRALATALIAGGLYAGVGVGNAYAEEKCTTKKTANGESRTCKDSYGKIISISTKKSKDGDADGKIDYIEYNKYDSNGRVVESLVDNDGDGKINTFLYLKYNSEGDLIQTSQDWDEDGRIEDIVEYKEPEKKIPLKEKLISECEEEPRACTSDLDSFIEHYDETKCESPFLDSYGEKDKRITRKEFGLREMEGTLGCQKKEQWFFWDEYLGTNYGYMVMLGGLTRIFKELDTNGDGYIDEDDDIDKDNMITLQDMRLYNLVNK